MPPRKCAVDQEQRLIDLLAWFQSSHTFYTIKEIESKASKSCKIPSIQIKELVSNLVNEGLIEQEKCGVTNLYWSFKHTKKMQKIELGDKLTTEIEQNKQLEIKLNNELEISQSLRSVESLPNREADIKKLHDLQQKLDKLKMDKEMIKLSNNLQHDLNAIEFYNESIETIIQHFSLKTNLPITMLKQELNIPLDLDYSINSQADNE